MFFNNCPELELFVSFDLNRYPYTACAVEYFYNKYSNRFLFKPGDSIKTIPDFINNYPYFQFDLIFVDGCHAYEWALSDITNARRLAHKDSILWVDDVPEDFSGPVGQAVLECERQGLIQIIGVNKSDHPTQFSRSWLEAKFLFSE